MFAVRALGLIDNLQQFLEGLLLVSGTTLRQQAFQGRSGASAHITLRLQEPLLRVSEVDAHSEHLCPSLAKAVGALNAGGDLRHLLKRGARFILHDGKRMLGYFDQILCSMRDAPHEVLRVVFQNPRRNDAEAAREQWLASLLPVVQDRPLHGAPGAESLRRVLPEVLLEHERELRLQEEIAFAVRPEDEHCHKLLLFVPLGTGVHLLYEKELVHSENSVVRHPPLGKA
mmetsp:Transcript_97548/g.176231  ORF Transcript_97548/g.176231 Transcript_97548/m.176231 type:complete len:229 (-) Transcript_97548:590-1276(-)